MIAAEGQDEITRVVLECRIGGCEPDAECEPAGQLAALMEEVRIRGQHGPRGEQAVIRGEADAQCQFDVDEGLRRFGQALDFRRLLHRSDAEQGQLEAGAELHGEQRKCVDQLEGGELDAGGQPVLALHDGKMVAAELLQHALRSAGSG